MIRPRVSATGQHQPTKQCDKAHRTDDGHRYEKRLHLVHKTHPCPRGRPRQHKPAYRGRERSIRAWGWRSREWSAAAIMADIETRRDCIGESDCRKAVFRFILQDVLIYRNERPKLGQHPGADMSRLQAIN